MACENVVVDKQSQDTSLWQQCDVRANVQNRVGVERHLMADAVVREDSAAPTPIAVGKVHGRINTFNTNCEHLKLDTISGSHMMRNRRSLPFGYSNALRQSMKE